MAPHARLVPFAPEHADAVLGWPRSAAELADWCSRTAFPPTRVVFDEWHAADHVHAFVLLGGDGPVAYGEVWEDAEEEEAELARIIVSPAQRGRGVGRAFVRLLADEARRRGFDDVWLRVVPTNEPALTCYREAGFARADAEREAAFNRGQPRVYVWMRDERG